MQDQDDSQSRSDSYKISRPRLEKLLIIFGSSAVMTGFAINHFLFNGCGVLGL